MAGRNPYTQLPGYVVGYNEYPNKWLVVFDRRKMGPTAPDAGPSPWVVKHMESGKIKFYPTKESATQEAYRCSQSVHTHDQWWNDRDG